MYRIDTYIVRVAAESQWDSRTSSASERVPYDERLGLGGNDWLVLSTKTNTQFITIIHERYGERMSRMAKMRITTANQVEFYDHDGYQIQGDRVQYRRWLGSHE